MLSAPQDTPVVYLGPSLSNEAAAAVHAECSFRPPIGRFDLYADRNKGHSVFLIIDGKFMQENAVSPREVIDVIRDGALVMGASSMGALRAAECWPAGMRGIGRIYEMFKDWTLDTDDEVAVAVSPTPPHEALSLALINVRYAMEKAVAGGVLDQAEAARILKCAGNLFYTERTWRSVLHAAGYQSDDLRRLLEYCGQHDLKRADALLAISELRRLIGEEPDVFVRHSRRSSRDFSASEFTRERMFDPLDGRHPQEARGELLDWLIGSGRYWRYMPRMAAAHLGQWSPSFFDDALHATPASPVHRACMRCLVDRPITGAATLHDSLEGLAVVLLRDGPAFAGALWGELGQVGALTSELMRMAALRRLAEAAQRERLKPRGSDVVMAQESILIEHSFASWESLRESAIGRAAWPRVERSLSTLALARCMRRHLFTVTERDVSRGK
jgi:hypothetical protein